MRSLLILLVFLGLPFQALAQGGPLWEPEPVEAVDPNGNLIYVASEPEDLEGLWAATFWDPCRDLKQITETVEIQVEGTTITAVQVSADGCVPPGTVRWSGTLHEGALTIRGEATVADSSKGPRYQTPVVFDVLGRNEIGPRTRLDTYRRIERKAELKPGERMPPKSLAASGDLDPLAEEAPEIAPPPPPEKPEGGHIEVQATFSKTGEPVIGYTLYLRRIGNSRIIAQHPMGGGDGGRFTFRDLEPGSYTVRIGEQELPVDQDKALVRIDLLEREETREVSVELDPTAVTIRSHFTAHGPGDTQDKVRFAQLIIEPSEGEAQEITTGKNGRIEVTLKPAPKSYTLRLKLRNWERFEVRSTKGYNGEVVELISRRITVEGTESVNSFELLPEEYNLDKDRMSQAKRDVLRDAAYSYVQLEKAATFADKHFWTLNSSRKLSLRLYEENTKFSFDPETGAVHLSDLDNHSSYLSEDAPLNREFHLFAHHLHHTSSLSRPNNLPAGAVPSATTNFNYVLPPGAAFYEAFAVYFAAMVNGSPIYRWKEGKADLETNGFRIKDFYEGFGEGPVMELNVASLLWDLTDETNEPGDSFSLSLDAFWHVMNARHVSSISGLFSALKQEFGGRSTANSDDDLLTDDVEELFIMHGFFDDRDGDGKWDANESIGSFNYQPD